MIKVTYIVGYYYDLRHDLHIPEPDFIKLEALFDKDITTDELKEELNNIIHSNFHSAWLVDWEVREIVNA